MGGNKETITLFETIIKTAQVIILQLDKEGRIVNYNPYMEKLTGYKIEEVMGKDWFTTFLPECDYDKIRNLFKKAIYNIETKGNVNPILNKDGQEIFIEWYDKTLKNNEGKVIGLLSVGHNVSDRIRSETRLKNSEEMYRVLFELNSDLISLSKANGKILVANKSWKNILGKYKHLHEEFLDNVHLNDRDKLKEAWNHMVKDKKQIKNLRFRYKNKENYNIFKLNVIPIMFSGNECYYSIARDITKKVNLDHELKEKMLQVESMTELNKKRYMKLIEREMEIIRLKKRLVK